MLDGIPVAWRLSNVTSSGTVIVKVIESVSMPVVVTGVLNVSIFVCVDVKITVFVKLVAVLVVWDAVWVTVLRKN